MNIDEMIKELKDTPANNLVDLATRRAYDTLMSALPPSEKRKALDKYYKALMEKCGPDNDNIFKTIFWAHQEFNARQPLEKYINSLKNSNQSSDELLINAEQALKDVSTLIKSKGDIDTYHETLFYKLKSNALAAPDISTDNDANHQAINFFTQIIQKQVLSFHNRISPLPIVDMPTFFQAMLDNKSTLPEKNRFLSRKLLSIGIKPSELITPEMRAAGNQIAGGFERNTINKGNKTIRSKENVIQTALGKRTNPHSVTTEPPTISEIEENIPKTHPVKHKDKPQVTKAGGGFLKHKVRHAGHAQMNNARKNAKVINSNLNQNNPNTTLETHQQGKDDLYRKGRPEKKLHVHSDKHKLFESASKEVIKEGIPSKSPRTGPLKK
ncbi:MAG: hypothetical protein H2069_07205 [Legionella sp.]|nr:hypothetical protein [Legionella sp.]